MVFRTKPGKLATLIDYESDADETIVETCPPVIAGVPTQGQRLGLAARKEPEHIAREVPTRFSLGHRSVGYRSSRL